MSATVSPSTYPSSTPWQSWFATSHDGNVIGHQRFDHTKCVRYPDDDACHTQFWAFDVWTRASGRLQTVYATQPVKAAWVGADGSVTIAFWLDAAGERLVYLKSWDEGAERTPHDSLHAGRAR